MGINVNAYTIIDDLKNVLNNSEITCASRFFSNAIDERIGVGCLDLKIENMDTIFFLSFNWEGTDEGEDCWSEIEDEWLNFLGNSDYYHYFTYE